MTSLNPTTATGPSVTDPREGPISSSGRAHESDTGTGNRPAQAIEKWAAIAGRWKFSKKGAEYQGPGEKEAWPPLGLAKAAPLFRDGVICTRITLSRAEKTTGGVFLGFQSAKSNYFVAQIGAFDRAYVIAEYRPEAGWLELAGAGLLSNLSPDTAYDVKVSVSGQLIRLAVDGVDVLNAVLPRPFEGTGFGLYAWGDAPITFAGTTVDRSVPGIFVIMPFSEPFDTLYRDVILPVARKLGFEVVRVDEAVGPGIIIEAIQRQVEGAHAVVAEISTRNPNVFYELGYAHALRKPAILLVRRQEGQTMPFDIRGYRAIFYDDNIGGKKTVERNLEQHLKAILGE